MRGTVVKRGRTWSYVVDVGRDPVTGRRRQRWRGGFASKRDAEHALAVQMTGAEPSTAKSYAEIIRWYIQPRIGAIFARPATTRLPRD